MSTGLIFILSFFILAAIAAALFFSTKTEEVYQDLRVEMKKDLQRKLKVEKTLLKDLWVSYRKSTNEAEKDVIWSHIEQLQENIEDYKDRLRRLKL